MEFSKVMVIGAGQMGGGIAQVMAQNGITVVLRDIKQSFVDKGIKNIDENLSRSVAKGKLTDEEKNAVMGRISGVVDLDETNCEVDLAIEAATENIAIKRDIFKTLDELCPANTILASNTSSVSITLLGAFTKRPDKFIGMSTLDGGRIGIAAQALGIAAGALERTVSYVKERKQFGRAIAGFQNTQFTLADMATEVEAARCLVYKAATAKDAKQKFSIDAAMAKLKASRVAEYVTDRAVQLHGGYGYIREYEVERMMRDAKITEIYEGTSEVMKMVISGSLLK